MGKSSIINMVLGSKVAAISGGAVGCTFESTSYLANIGGSEFRLHDTAGLNEGEDGTVPAKEAVVNLYKLIRRLEDGVSLLVYCVRGPKIKDTTVKNYKIFYEAFCQKQVPVAIVVTGLENEESMEGWWAENEASFTKYGMRFDGHACVTATKGKKNRFEEEYEESVKIVRDLISACSATLPWKKEAKSWFLAVLESIWSSFVTTIGFPINSIGNALTYALTLVGVSQRDAIRLASGLEIDLASGT